MSPCTIRILAPDGLHDADYTADSLAEAVRYEPADGVYTLTNTYNTFQTLKLDAHLDRLEDSARRENIPLRLDRGALRAGLRRMITEAGYGDVRFRITAGRQSPDRLILSIEPFAPLPSELIARGIHCMTMPNAARRNPAAKSSGWLHTRAQIRGSLPDGIYEGLLLSPDGYILEGLSSNFYAILAGQLRTADTGILFGISRQIVLAVAPDVLSVNLTAVNVAELPNVSEAFITSSSRGIVPVVEIDGSAVGRGEPGEMTMALRRVYNDWIVAHLETL